MFLLVLLSLVLIQTSSNSQPNQTNNGNLNFFQEDPNEINGNMALGKMRVGIGPTISTTAMPPIIIVDPQDLLHIHGWNVDAKINNVLVPVEYNEPTLRISLQEDNFDPIAAPPAQHSRIFGFLTMNNPGSINTYSSIAQNKYDYILGTTRTFNPIYENQTSINPVTDKFKYDFPFNYDLIITSNNPRGAIRFGTTPPPDPLPNSEPNVYMPVPSMPTPQDVERMTILNNGNVGIGATMPKSLLQVGANIVVEPEVDGDWGGIKYNDFWDGTTGRRIERGAANGILFIPANLANFPASIPGDIGGIRMYTSSVLAEAGDAPSAGGSDLTLRPESLKLWRDNIELIKYEFPTSQEATDGKLYIKDKVHIGKPDLDEAIAHPPFGGSYKLVVDGSILAKEIVVDARQVTWSDFVFAPGYKLMPLQELEQAIKEVGHLPGIPSADEVQAQGLPLGEFQSKLLQKIEELTLYVIQLKKENSRLSERIGKVESNR